MLRTCRSLHKDQPVQTNERDFDHQTPRAAAAWTLVARFACDKYSETSFNVRCETRIVDCVVVCTSTPIAISHLEAVPRRRGRAEAGISRILWLQGKSRYSIYTLLMNSSVGGYCTLCL